MEYIIETKNLVKTYKSRNAVDDVSIHVKKGDIYGLIGKNGAGKTTLMKLILGLSKPNNGEIYLYGDSNLNEGRKKIGSLIEAPGLYKNCTAYENMLRFAKLFGADKNTIKDILTKVGLGDTGSKKAGQFSLGMKQRLGLAIALLGNPEVLILDEPINGLDPAGIKEIRDIILDLNKNGVTFIISSHLLDELAKVVNCYGIISEGKLIEEITADELQEHCQKSTRIKCDDIDKSLKLLQRAYPDLEYKIKLDRLHIYNHLDESAAINKLLVSNSISVSEISHSETDLEQYFIERLGR